MPGIDGKLLREWRRARGWDVPQLARQLRRASREPVAAHDGLVRMIRSWERGAHALSERYELLYRALGFGATGPEDGDGARPPGQARAAQQAEMPAHPSTSAPYATLGTADAHGPDTDTVEVCCRTPDGRIIFVAVPLRQLTGGAAPAVPLESDGAYGAA
jgi:transcriptional regulator with XRE-family HTH domain